MWKLTDEVGRHRVLRKGSSEYAEFYSTLSRCFSANKKEWIRSLEPSLRSRGSEYLQGQKPRQSASIWTGKVAWSVCNACLIARLLLLSVECLDAQLR